MCGVPFHAAESYIETLVKKGYKVAICEQLEDPKAVKGIVKRDVIKVITPGTVMTENGNDALVKQFFIVILYGKRCMDTCIFRCIYWGSYLASYY